MQIASNSALLKNIMPIFTEGVLGLFAIILSAFFGGLFAGVWANHFESKRRIKELRHDKYHEHRNSIVQIEQELIPLRVNASRNLESISDAIKNTHESNIRFILRFYKLSLSTGLGMKLLNIEFINKYAQLYSEIETFNSDLEYVSGMVTMVRENNKAGFIDPSVNESYKTFLPHLKDQIENIDQKSLELLAISKLAIGKEDKGIKDQYIKDGKEIKYTLDKKSMENKYKEIKDEEDPSLHKDEKRPKFISPFLDLKKVIIQQESPNL